MKIKEQINYHEYFKKVIPELTKKTEQYLISNYGREEKPREYFRASSLGLCHRQRIWVKRGEPKTNPKTIRELRKLAAGEWLHNFYYQLWEGSGLKQIEEEVELPELDLVGHYDAMIEHDGVPLLIDLKSQHSWAFHYDRKEGTGRKPHQVMQLGAYLWAKDMPAGLIWKFSKDDFTESLYPAIIDDRLKDEIRADIKLLEEHEENKTLPEIDYKTSPQQGMWECEWCEFRNKCLGLDKEYENKYKEYLRNKRRKK